MEIRWRLQVDAKRCSGPTPRRCRLSWQTLGHERFQSSGDVVDRAMGFAVGVLVLSLAACETEGSIGPPKVTATFGVGA